MFEAAIYIKGGKTGACVKIVYWLYKAAPARQNTNMTHGSCLKFRFILKK
jgi:hypothetical protein